MIGRRPLVNILIVCILLASALFFRQRRDIPDERNSSYEIDGLEVSLKDGKSSLDIEEGAASRLETEFIISRAGDLNADGRADAALFLRQRSGGSGTFYYIAAALAAGGGYEGLNAVFLGDRIEPQDITIEDGLVTAVFLDRRDDQAFSAAPSVETTVRLELRDGRLVRTGDR